MPAHFGVLYYQVAGRADDGDQRSGEEHLDEGDISFVAVEDLGEGVGVVDAEALAGADSQTAVVLVEGDKVERAARHGGVCGVGSAVLSGVGMRSKGVVLCRIVSMRGCFNLSGNDRERG